MSLPPNTDLVARAWLRLAAAPARADWRLPAADDAMRADGFVRVVTVGGSPNVYVPLRAPVVAAQCFVAPTVDSTGTVPWMRAAALVERVLAATYDPSLANLRIDLSSVGDYGPARVLTVSAIAEPRRIPDDAGDFARFDLDLALDWRADA